MDTTCAADVDNNPRLLVLDAEIRRGLSHQPERRSVVHCKHGIPLLIGDLQIHQGYPSLALHMPS